MLVEQEAIDVFLAALSAIVLHFIFLTFNIIVTWLLRFPEAERKAIIIMASQKNLPTAATIISYFDSSVGNLGLITIPCIVFYIMQVRGGGEFDSFHPFWLRLQRYRTLNLWRKKQLSAPFTRH